LIYVFDTNTLSNVLNHYYPDRFPSFWNKLAEVAGNGLLVSVRECELELAAIFDRAQLERLRDHNASFFSPPTLEELDSVRRIYSVPHFRQNLETKKLLEGGPFADPFVIARASVLNGTVVTEEKFKLHAAKIPNICAHFRIGCANLQEFLLAQNWTF
jgi:hypothetical protein